jgi:hypothetical protein
MANLFSRLAERALGVAPVAQPDLPSMFAPLAPMELSTQMSAGSESARADRSTSDNAAPIVTSQNTSTQPQPAPPVGRARRDAELPPPLVNVRPTKSKSARDRFPFAAEANSKSESGRVLDNSFDHDRRASADEARPQSVSRETLVRQAARPAIADFASSSAERSEAPAPTIQVSIGRVEVRAVTPPTPAPRVVEKKAPLLLSLDQYLRDRNEGRR